MTIHTRAAKAATLSLAAAAAALALAPMAFGHATFEVGEAVVNTTYKAVLRVPHGCDGEPTLRVRVQIPEGMIAVKPMPKAGWDLEVVTGPYARAYTLYGSEVSEGVQEIVWSGELDDVHYDEFVFRGQLTDALPVGEMLYIPVVQECATGAERWIETPAEGQSADDLASPAPGVMILAAQG